MLWVIFSENPLANERDTPPTTLKLLKNWKAAKLASQTHSSDGFSHWMLHLQAWIQFEKVKPPVNMREVRFVHQNGKRCIYIYMKRWDCRLYIVSYKYELHISMAHEHDLGIVSGRFKLIQTNGSLKVIPNWDAMEICQGLHIDSAFPKQEGTLEL